VKGVLTVV